MIKVAWLKRLRYPVALCGLLNLYMPSLGAAERMAPGQWEFALTTDGFTHTMSQCITAEKALQFNGDSKSGREHAEKDAKGRCTINSYEIAGDVVSYSMTCGSMHMDSVTTFHGNSSDGTLVSTAQGKTTRTQVKARRSGACK